MVINSIVSEVSARSDLRVIVFDGFSDAGKTTIAKDVAKSIQGVAVDTDCYVNQQNSDETYLNCLDLTSLSLDLNKAIEEGRKVCLSGICIQELCRLLDIEIDYRVYIKKLSLNTNAWHGAFEIEDYKNNPESLEGGLAFHVCDMEYHIEYEPHLNADQIVPVYHSAPD